MRKSQFEVVIGTLDVSTEYFGIVAAFADRLDLVSVAAEGQWDGPRARNMALRQATGHVVAFVEADIILPGDYLQRLVDEHFSDKSPKCVMGELVGYADDVEVEQVDIQPLEHYLARLDDLAAVPDADRDSRLAYPDPPMFWPLGWGASIAVTRSAVIEHDVWFDETFAGWGLFDQEWALQLEAAGIRMVFARGLAAFHVPHARTLAENFGPQFRANQMRMLEKWPIRQVELVLAYGWRGALERHEDLCDEVEGILGPDRDFCVLSCEVDGERVVMVGAVRVVSTGEVVTDVSALVPTATTVDVMPLLGRLLPFEDGAAERCLVLPDVLRLSGRMPMRITAEVSRVGTVELVGGASPSRGAGAVPGGGPVIA